MTTELQSALADLATEAPAYSPAWASGARDLARTRRHRARVGAAGALAAVVLVTAAVVALPGRGGAPQPAEGPPQLPSRIDAPSSPPPSVLDQPIRRAAALASGGSAGQFLLDADGGGARGMPYPVEPIVGGAVVTFAAGQGCAPALSPDGLRLAWLECTHSAGAPGVVKVLTLASGAVKTWRVDGTATQVTLQSLKWSPDGTALAMVDRTSFTVLDLMSGSVNRAPAGFGAALEWSPSSELLAGQVDDLGGLGKPIPITVYDRNLSAVRTLKVPAGSGGAGGYSSSFQWELDGKSLTALEKSPGVVRLVSVPVDGSTPRSTTLHNELTDVNRMSGRIIGWRAGRPVLELWPLQTYGSASNVGPVFPSWIRLDPGTQKYETLLTAGTVHIDQVPAQILETVTFVDAGPAPKQAPPSQPDPAAGLPAKEPLPPSWSSQVTALGVTLPTPQGWRADSVPFTQSTQSARLWSAQCIHAGIVKASVSCENGILVERITAAKAKGFTSAIQVQASGSSRPCGKARDLGTSEGSEQLAGEAAQVRSQKCSGNKGIAWWALPDSTLVLQADLDVSATAASVRAARVRDIGGPKSSLIDTQGNGITVRVPISWNDHGRGAECLGPAVNGVPVDCPVDGLLVRGKRFFDKEGGKVTPDPDIPLGYKPSPRKVEADIASGCDALGGLGYSTTADTGGVSLKQTRKEPTTVAGHPGTYVEWAAKCPDGTEFTWRRWWVPKDRLMVDSYDLPGGADPAVISDIMTTGITWD